MRKINFLNKISKLNNTNRVKRMGPDSLIELGFKRKTLKEGKTPETAAHKITKDYMGEILEKTIQSYMGRKPGITPWRYFRKTVT